VPPLGCTFFKFEFLLKLFQLDEERKKHIVPFGFHGGGLYGFATPESRERKRERERGQTWLC